jgi:hypothetical protein
MEATKAGLAVVAVVAAMPTLHLLLVVVEEVTLVVEMVRMTLPPIAVREVAVVRTTPAPIQLHPSHQLLRMVM